MELPSASSLAIEPASTTTTALTLPTSLAKQAKQSRSSKGMHLVRRVLSSHTFGTTSPLQLTIISLVSSRLSLPSD